MKISDATNESFPFIDFTSTSLFWKKSLEPVNRDQEQYHAIPRTT
jgi:hypothetical protein